MKMKNRTILCVLFLSFCGFIFSQEITNEKDLEPILNTKSAMRNKPVIVVLTLKGPAILAEFEKQVQSIVVSFGGVEEQKEDVPRDMECYVDGEGNTYDFGFGLN